MNLGWGVKKIICIVTMLFIGNNVGAGFESPEDQKNKRLTERAVETNKYIDSMVGKTAWYNSSECITEKIYPDTNNMSYGAAVYSTDGEYKSAVFNSAEVLQDTYKDYVTFKLTINGVDEGYIQTNTVMPLKISDNDYTGCFKANKPTKKESRLDQLEKALSEGTYTHPDSIEWQLDCKKDKFNGSKSCYLHKSNSNVMVGIYNGQHSVYIGRNHYPRTQSAIKIDSNASIYGNEGSSNSPSKVIEQMKNGKIAYTRYKEWPYEYNKDGEVDLSGFKEKYNEMLEEYKKL